MDHTTFKRSIVFMMVLLITMIWATASQAQTQARAPGNGAPIGGIKVIAESGWFAARPSGTENIYKIYAESFHGENHLRHILEEAQTIVNEALKAATSQDKSTA